MMSACSMEPEGAAFDGGAASKIRKEADACPQNRSQRHAGGIARADACQNGPKTSFSPKRQPSSNLIADLGYGYVLLCAKNLY
jgi:hypothetical protein